MCQSVESIYSCNCPAENYIQRCKFPGLKCVENLREPTPVSLGVLCSKHTSKLDRKAAKAAKKEQNTNYPPTSFTKKVVRQLSNSQLSRNLSSRNKAQPQTPTSEYNSGRRPSVSSSIYSDDSVASSTRSQSARSRAESYAKLLDLGPLSLEQSASLAEAQAALRRSIELDARRRASAAEVFDNEIAPAISRPPSHTFRQTILNVVERRNLQPQSTPMDPILSPRTADTHPALRDQLSPRIGRTRMEPILSPHPALRDQLSPHNPRTPATSQESTASPVSPRSPTRNASLQEKAARIRASLDHERALITDLSRRPASATAKNTSKPISPIMKKREYNSWAACPSHTRTERNADRLPQTPQRAYQRSSRKNYDDILEEDIEVIKQLSDCEKYELFLEKDRKQTALELQRRAQRKARGGFVGELREKSDGLCVLM